MVLGDNVVFDEYWNAVQRPDPTASTSAVGHTGRTHGQSNLITYPRDPELARSSSNVFASCNASGLTCKTAFKIPTSSILAVYA